MTTTTITLIGDTTMRHHMLSSNSRHHWTRTRAASRYWRWTMFAEARRLHAPQLGSAHITITIRWPDNRHRDVHNYVHHVAKPIVDGLVKAGVLPDDSDEYLSGPDMRRDPEKGPLAIRIDINELNNEGTSL